MSIITVAELEAIRAEKAMQVQKKRCTRCSGIKPLTDFENSKSYQCKTCESWPAGMICKHNYYQGEK